MTDNRELLNDAEVDFLLSGATEGGEATSPELDDGNQTVTMRGDLDQISLADIFQTLSMSKMEGVLRVRNPLEERQVFCSDGYVRILVPQRLVFRRLGQRLLQAGLIQVEQLRSALLEQRKEKLPLGEVLVQAGCVEQEQVDEILAMQVAEDLFSLFTWRHGTFEFFKGDPVSDSVRATFADCPEFEISSLLLEVARRSDEWQSILEAIENLDEIPGRIADPADPAGLSDSHRDVLAGVDGIRTYRQIADQTTVGLFEAARAARDLVRGGILARIDDETMVEVARALAEEGEKRRAVMILQTLRDRQGELPLEVIRGMAQVLEKAGERRFAGMMLLEAAQQAGEPELALDLARAARKLVPHDPAALSFLRTTLIAHDTPDSPELEKITVDLLDALIDADAVPTALEIIEDARQTGTRNAHVMTREARARQKAQDGEGAIEVLLELAKIHLDAGNRPKAIEAYEAVLRIDRGRRDVQRTLAHMRRTKVGRIVRVAGVAVSLLLIGGMGFVWWQQHSLEQALQQASSEVSGLLEQGDRTTARERLDAWREKLGPCEAITDLESSVAFAESAEKTRREKLRRLRVNEQLGAAATALGQGEVSEALRIYGEPFAEADLTEEVRQVVARRMQALLDEVEECAEKLPSRLPPHPDQLFDRKEMVNNLAELQRTAPPGLLRAHEQLRDLMRETTPELFDPSVLRRLNDVLKVADAPFARARELGAAYAEALQRNDVERRLDPLFKAAVAKETELAFAEALELYRQLEKQPTGDPQMRAHFRDRVARNATIVRLLEALRTATDGGDFDSAQQQLRALRATFPDVPFDRLVRLPLYVRSVPEGAAVACNGKEVGRTPLLLARSPADTTNLQLSLSGFEPFRDEVDGDGRAEVFAHLTLLASGGWQHQNAIDVQPAVLSDGSLVCVDRSGDVVRLSPRDGKQHWRFSSGDLSGLLSAPRIDKGRAIVASLDGELRAIELDTGKVAWQLPDLPCEVVPTIVDRLLLMATTDRRLHAISLDERRRYSVDLPEAARGQLMTLGQRVLVVGEAGLVMCWNLPDLSSAWRTSLPELSAPSATLVGNTLLLGDDQGHLVVLDAANGQIRWRQDLRTSVLGQPTLIGNSVWCTTPERLLRRSLVDGSEMPPIPRGKHDWTGQPHAVGNRVVVPLRNEQLQVLDSATGRTLYRLQGGRRSSVQVVQSRLLVGDEGHRVRSYDQLP